MLKVELFRVEEPKLGPVSNSRELYESFKQFAEADREMFIVVFLNIKNRPIDWSIIHIGATDSSIVEPRSIFKAAVLHSAANICLLHNHPSGDPEPSLCDKQITQQLTAGAHILGIRILDHLVIGKGKYFSFADEGLMDGYQTEAQAVLKSRGLL